MKLSLWQLALPIPHKAQPVRLANEEFYEIEMTQQSHDFHPDAQAVPVWCYADKSSHSEAVAQTYLGPTIEATQGKPVRIRWINRLPIDKTLPFTCNTLEKPGASCYGHNQIPEPGHAIVHLHGAHCPAESNGYPSSYLQPYSVNQPESGKYSLECIYPNNQHGTTLWYHDHTLGITRLNVYAGLTGLYLLRDAAERTLALPKAEFEIPLILQDRTFQAESEGIKMHYAVSDEQTAFFGDHLVVNGAVWPYFKAEQRRYRFRILNASNARFYRLKFKSLNSCGNFPLAYQIGTDGGFLPAPVPVLTTVPLIVAPGERADVIIDFSQCSIADEFLMENDATAPFSVAQCLLANDEMRNVLKFIIQPIKGMDDSLPVDQLTLPCHLKINIDGFKIPLNKVSSVKMALSHAGLPKIKTRKMTLVDTTKLVDGRTVPDQVLLNNFQFRDLATETPRLNEIEIWEIDNKTTHVQPIHLQLVQFLLLDRAGIVANVAANEASWKDTVRCNPGEITRIIARFSGYTGRFVWQSHILEHQDNDMMRPLEVRY